MISARPGKLSRYRSRSPLKCRNQSQSRELSRSLSQSPRRFEHYCSACTTRWTALRRISRCPSCHPKVKEDRARAADALPLSVTDDSGVAWVVKDASNDYVSRSDGRLAWLKPDPAARTVTGPVSGSWTFTTGAAITANGSSYMITALTANPDGSVTAQLGGTATTSALLMQPHCLRCLMAGVPLDPKERMCGPCMTAVRQKEANRFTPRCKSCKGVLSPAQLPGQRCRSCEVTYQKNKEIAAKKTAAEKEAARLKNLPVVQQDDPIQATKYAQLMLGPDGKPFFAGVGYGEYHTESYAVCGQGKTHTVPDPECQCGFWVGTRDGSKLSTWNAQQVALEVELAGTVLDCARDGTPVTDAPWGYRAQWQRVLSVSLSPECGMAALTTDRYSSYYQPLPTGCDGPPLFLCAHGAVSQKLLTACQAHVTAKSAIKKPVSFLREFLQTEIRPGTVTDDAVPRTAPDVEQLRKDWADEVRSITSRLVKLENLPLPSLIVPVGSVRKVDVNGITYTLKGTSSGWEIDRVDSPELDALKKRALDIQALYRAGKISRKDIESLSTYINLT